MLRWWRSLSDMNQLAIVMALSAGGPLLLGLALTLKLATGNF